MEHPLINKQYLLERFPGKGGWTYVAIPEISRNSDAAFGMLKVRGSIDGYEFSGHTLMPLGNGAMMMPVRAAIRKEIKKEEGDMVHVILFKDDAPYTVPDVLKLRLEEAGAFGLFNKHKPWEQKMCADKIFSAKREETVNERIIRLIGKLKRNEKIV